jgi:hypothetical protein
MNTKTEGQNPTFHLASKKPRPTLLGKPLSTAILMNGFFVPLGFA